MQPITQAEIQETERLGFIHARLDVLLRPMQRVQDGLIQRWNDCDRACGCSVCVVLDNLHVIRNQAATVLEKRMAEMKRVTAC